jgi:hypothetical protein
MSIATDIVRSRRAHAVVAVTAAWLLFQLWLSLSAPGKIAAELAGTSPKVNVQIELPFAPERFHLLTFQQYGRVAGADDHSIALRGVNRTDLNAVARPYWVTSVGPIKEGG